MDKMKIIHHAKNNNLIIHNLKINNLDSIFIEIIQQI
jgi:hypothetical protein